MNNKVFGTLIAFALPVIITLYATTFVGKPIEPSKDKDYTGEFPIVVLVFSGLFAAIGFIGGKTYNSIEE